MTSTRSLLATVATLLVLLSPAVPARDAGAFFGDGAADEAARIARALELKPGSVIADVGAGDGSYAIALAKLVGPGGRVYATELEDDALAEIRGAVEDAGVSNVTVLQGAVAATNLPADCCDAVLLRDVYHHLTEPSAMNASIRAALRPGGRFLAIDFPPTVWLAPWTPDGVPADRGGHGVPTDVLVREVEAAGFTMVRVVPDWDPGWFIDLYAVLFEKPAGGGTPAP
jgi:predicted methyltransferase